MLDRPSGHHGTSVRLGKTYSLDRVTAIMKRYTNDFDVTAGRGADYGGARAVHWPLPGSSAGSPLWSMYIETWIFVRIKFNRSWDTRDRVAWAEGKWPMLSSLPSSRPIASEALHAHL